MDRVDAIPHPPTSVIKCLNIAIRGAVQGVGFRPFIYRLANDLALKGWVLNDTHGVYIEAEGDTSLLENFLLRIRSEKPPRSYIQSLESRFLDPRGYSTFEIRESRSGTAISAIVLPDIAACPDCLKEVFDPANRRYLYPFTNCTNCGPRYSIIETLPYDRPNTTMKIFTMCEACRYEYENPLDRRFHAQPNACPVCGPHIELWDHEGKMIIDQHDAITQTSQALRSGKIIAMKGIGGFHLVVDARNSEAVGRLRERKHREEKPLALLYPSIESIRNVCSVSALEEHVLLSPESPIVLLKRLSKNYQDTIPVSPSVAPENPYLGIMLPYSPLHHILMQVLQFPVVATSGNLSDEPICIDEKEALKRLGNIADLFLVHNRPIRRHVDDSIVRMIMGRELVLRRGRGYAPLPVEIPGEKNSSQTILAVGAHLKNTIAVSSGNNIFLSQHIGDLETEEAYGAFEDVIDSLTTLYNIRPSVIATDMHPAYLSSVYADGRSESKIQVQHHYAHIQSCMAENQIEDDVLGIAWDGTGFGTDGTIWGGEFITVSGQSFERIATFRRFRLPGGDRAIREPGRSAIGILYEMYGDDLFIKPDFSLLLPYTKNELGIFQSMLKRGINSPLTSSAGRLFDAVASISGVRQIVNYEGQAAMQLEFLTDTDTTEEKYTYAISQKGSPIIIDWSPIFSEIIQDVKKTASPSRISRKFHNTLSSIIYDVALLSGRKKVVLTGGCFQNKYLAESAISRLICGGFLPYWHQRVPPNDGGISLGQIAVVSKELNKNAIENEPGIQ